MNRLLVAGSVCAALAIFFLCQKRPFEGKGGSEGIIGTKRVVRDGHDKRSRVRETKNPREAFEKARKRGLTEKEVRAVLDEFVATGLLNEFPAEVSPELFHEAGNVARAWYLDILLDGFVLTRKQETEARENLRKMGELRLSEFNKQIEWLEKTKNKAETSSGLGEIYHRTYPSVDDQDGLEWMYAKPWRLFESPWKLFKMNEIQREMVGSFTEEGRWEYVDGNDRTLDFDSKDFIMDMSDPFLNVSSTVATILTNAGRVFPLSMNQFERITEGEETRHLAPLPEKDLALMNKLRNLTGPQLKTLFYFDRDTARQLVREIVE